MEHSTSRKPGAPSGESTAERQDLAGETFDGFRVLRQLGEGGMGRVYLAEQISLKRKVAIKVLREEIASTPAALLRFRAESQTIALLSHANVVQAYTVGEHKGRHYLVLEYVDGVSLRYYLTKKGPLEVPLALSIMRQVASALQRAGELSILHRDIKPENILLTRKGEAKVADFGLARCLTMDETLDLTRSGTAVGTPRYMSPEQLEGKPVDQRTDIYSFGVTCYEMLAGQRPFDGTNAYEIALEHVREEPVPLESIRPGIPPPLCAIVGKMMAKAPEARYATAHALLKDLARVRGSLGSTAASVQTLSVAGETLREEDSSAPVPFWKRRRWSLALGAGALLLAGAVIAWSLQKTEGTDPPSPPGEAATHEVHKEPEETPKKEPESAAKKEKPKKERTFPSDTPHFPPGKFKPGRP